MSGEQFLKRYEQEFAPRLLHRANTFRVVFHYALKVLKQPPVIVEIGSVRDLGGWETDGQSTIMFNDFAVATGAKITSVDLDSEHTKLASMAAPNVNCITSDSVEFFKTYNGEPIDLLYLDGADDLSGDQMMKEFAAAEPHLSSPAIIVLDDTIQPIAQNMYWGKGKQLVPDLLNRRVPLLVQEYQAVFFWRKQNE